MRGVQTLFNDLFELQPVKESPRGKIQSTNSIRRNDCLIDRYYLYCKFYGFRYGLALKITAEDFFLSESTVQEILDDNYEKLAAVKKEAPKRIDLERKWPHLNWSPQVMID